MTEEKKAEERVVLMMPVESSNIKAIGYDRERKELTVEFHNGAKWAYEGVGLLLHRELMEADSVGSFFARFIKPKHPARRVA